MGGRRNNDPGKRAADAIVSAIENRIATGELKDESPLPSERMLMEEYGASRTVVREAITALSNRGLIVSKPRFRPVVRRVGFQTAIDATSPVIRQLLSEPEGVKNLFETRVFVESGLVRHAALHASRDDIRKLKSALKANQEAIADSDRFYRTDREFHQVLYQIPENPVFAAVHEGFFAWLAPQWEMMERSPEHNQLNFDAHAAIYEAILERDPDAAEAELVSHLKTAWQLVRSTFNWDN